VFHDDDDDDDDDDDVEYCMQFSKYEIRYFLSRMICVIFWWLKFILYVHVSMSRAVFM